MPKKNNLDLKNIKGTFTSVIDLEVLRGSEKTAELPTEIPILPKGEYMTLPYGNMVLDNNVFEQMIGNFNGNVRRAVPLDVDHAMNNTKAAGWIKELINKEDGLWAKVEYTKYGSELVSNREYRMISAEWSFDYVDPQKSTHHGAVLVAATLTNRPLMQSMPTITASTKDLTNPNSIVLLLTSDSKKEENKIMPTLTNILAKPVADRTEDELKFILDNEKELTEDQTAQLEKETVDAKEVEDAKAKADAEAAKAKEKEEADAKAKEDADAAAAKEAEEAEAAKEAANKDITIKASEFERLQKIESDMKASEVMKAAQDYTAPFLASSKGGKVLPVGKEALVKLATTLNEDQKTLLASVLKATADQIVTEEVGENHTEGLTASEQYIKFITTYAAENKKATITEIKNKFRELHPEVAKAYDVESN